MEKGDGGDLINLNMHNESIWCNIFFAGKLEIKEL